LNRPPDANRAAADKLCLVCGLCCNGVIFANVELQPGDLPEQLRSLGLAVRPPRSAHRRPFLSQPCAALDGCRCRCYAQRPNYCQAFECVLLKSVRAGRTDLDAAHRVIRTAQQRADRVRNLLRSFGDQDEAVALATRFRRLSKRFARADLEDEIAEQYASLTLAVHDLNLLLSEAFYPGRADGLSQSELATRPPAQ
jgi:uncharacterized protein